MLGSRCYVGDRSLHSFWAMLQLQHDSNQVLNMCKKSGTQGMCVCATLRCIANSSPAMASWNVLKHRWGCCSSCRTGTVEGKTRGGSAE